MEVYTNFRILPKQRVEPIKSIDTQKVFNYSMIVATRPEPTVLPPSRSDLVVFRNLFVTDFAVL